jgi:hypothetical protein
MTIASDRNGRASAFPDAQRKRRKRFFMTSSMYS